MRFSINLCGQFCLLLALAPRILSFPMINVTAEDFMNLDEIIVRSDDIEDMVCAGCTTAYSYTKVGDGDPHQNYVITQKGGSLVSCSDSSDQTESGYSNTIGWTISLGLESAFSSVGLEVEESQTFDVSTTFDCNGLAAEGGDICVMFYQAVTAFTVQVKSVTSCACGGSSTNDDYGTAIVYAPNTNKAGSIAGRGINVSQHGVVQCSGDSDRKVNYYCGPAGDPSWWDGRDDGPWIDDYVNLRQPAGCTIPIEAYKYDD
jgi:hypothetical protein